MRIAVVFAFGCSTGSPPCDVNADCPGGQVCSPEHTCTTGTGPDGSGAGDAFAACTPNHDGVIERDEIAIVVPATVNFRTSGEAAIDLHGTTDASGRRWSFTAALAGDRDTAVSTAALAGSWFADRFAGGQFTTPLSGAGTEDLLAVHAAKADKVQILGAASTMAGITQTVLTYDPPVDAFRFPIQVGQHFAGQSNVTGTAQGVPVILRDAWEQDVDAKGTVETPYGTFPVLRVRLQLARTIGLVTTTTTTFAFVAECFGTVATVTSRTNETTSEFETAAEVRRIAP